MITTFIRHELKAFWRSKNTGKSIAVRVIMGLLMLYLFANVLFAGIFLDELLAASFPHDDLVVSFCGVILIYFLFDLVMRMQLQELPTLKVQPYLHLPVKRNTVVKYLAFTAILSFFNLWPLMLFGPFVIKIITTDSGALVAAAFMVSIIGFGVFNNYLALFVKRKANLNGWYFLVFITILILILAGDFKFHVYSIRKISYLFFGHLIINPLLALIPAILAVGMYYLNFVYLKGNLYLEELSSRKASAYKSSTEYPFLNLFGKAGDLVANELKLIFRNKRPRSTLTMGCVFLFYGLFFYTQKNFHSDSFYIFIGLMLTGFFTLNYGRFMFSWQGQHFDGILVSKVKLNDFFKAKYLLLNMVSSVAFLLTIPYVYFGWHVLLIHFVLYLWNMGISATIVLFFANRNYKSIDLSKGASFNWEGIGATQLLLSLPVLLVPYLLYVPFKVFNHPEMGLALISIVSVVFILTRNYWIKKLEEDFIEKRYTIAEGFRNK